VHESTQIEPLLDGISVRHGGRGRPRKRARGQAFDKGYSYPRCRGLLHRRGLHHMIPEREDQRKQRRQKGQQGGRPCRYDHEMYRWRNVVERCINKLKQFRRVATRYDKRADSFLAFVTLATILLWLR
jgi:transposase